MTTIFTDRFCLTHMAFDSVSYCEFIRASTGVTAVSTVVITGVTIHHNPSLPEI